MEKDLWQLLLLFSWVPTLRTETHLGVHWSILGGGEAGVKEGTVFFGLYPYQKQEQKKVNVFLIIALQNCVFQNIYIYIFRTAFSPCFDLLLLQRTFPGVQILLQLKSPIIVRGACNTGYFDGHNTQN